MASLAALFAPHVHRIVFCSDGEIWKQLNKTGNLATTQNYPHATNSGKIDTNVCGVRVCDACGCVLTCVSVCVWFMFVFV